jgi:hypothetical protein
MSCKDDGLCDVFWGGSCVCEQPMSESLMRAIVGPNPARTLGVIMALAGYRVDEASIENAAEYCDELIPQWPFPPPIEHEIMGRAELQRRQDVLVAQGRAIK